MDNDDNPVEENGSLSTRSARSQLSDLNLLGGSARDWEVLDTCLNADDMRLVGTAYEFLKVLEGTRDVTPSVLKSSTGLEGIDIRPQLAIILGLAFMDSILLGGTCLAQISSYWPPYSHRILVHEARHLLVGVILDPIVAMQMGIQGQPKLLFMVKLRVGRMMKTSLEASVYFCKPLRPPPPLCSSARWSVLQSYNLLKWHRRDHQAAVKAMESGGSLSVVIRKIEEVMSSSR
ncbi:Phosphoglycerate kinase 1 [Hibiscus syriacus]|uniref:Phosphoglycerate kinase 1 n=1 Tax=Hibiscus syriacus TaxID=106335 RepID=A0A6A2ZKA0_HIBSY|nr:Phosphoglycerate kinase 1 [Hibiscus syriacus]